MLIHKYKAKGGNMGSDKTGIYPTTHLLIKFPQNIRRISAFIIGTFFA